VGEGYSSEDDAAISMELESSQNQNFSGLMIKQGAA
jgi:hypothetical protein